MKQSNAVAYLRQVCCAGLPAEMAVAEFIRGLHLVVPSLRNWYSVHDSNGGTVKQFPDYLCPEIIALAELSFVAETFLSSPIYLKTIKKHFQQNTYGTLESLLPAIDYCRTDFYNLIHRPLGQGIMLGIKVERHGVMVGSFVLTRLPGSARFNSREIDLLVRLSPYLAHALEAPAPETLAYADSGEIGVMVWDTQGNLQYLSDQARQSLALCHFPPDNNPVMMKLKQVCQHLAAIYQGKPALPPNYSHTNHYGRFEFRAQWLSKPDRESGNLIAMTIVHQEPLQLKVLRALATTALSPSQREAAALMAQGYSNEVIGKRMHVKLTTVKDHVSNIFTKLEINQREELLTKLLGMENAKNFKPSVVNPISLLH
jgi:DNA-binding CsgD family transcriptional regulator